MGSYMVRRGCRSFVLIAPLLAACSTGSVVSGGDELLDGGLSGSYGGNTGSGGSAGTGNDGGGTRVLSDGGIAAGFGAGQACTDTAAGRCRIGLSCASGICAFSHSTPLGSPCTAAEECASGSQCVAGVCAAAGQGVAADGCTSDSDCQAGLRCGIVGFAAECVPQGTSDVGQGCVTSSDCYAGLLCSPSSTTPAPATSSSDAGRDDGGAAPPSGVCAPIPPVGGVPFGIPVAPSLNCEPASQGTVTAYFEIPGATESTAGADFFRLPFPNDVRIENGKIDLSGFPTPGSSLLGFDPVQIYLDAISRNETAWGTYPTTIFRFSGQIDFATFSAKDGAPSPVQFLDITDPTSPSSGGATWSYSSTGGKYVCHDWLAVRPPSGHPLTPGHIYTIYLSSTGRDKNGHAITPSPELTSLLGSTAPTEAALANGYAAFKPLRDYLSAQGIQPTAVLNATVFTTTDTPARMSNLATATLAATAPSADGWVKCGGGTPSPCPQATGDRACGTGTADYDEYHALVTIPIFQNGTEPYLTSGGDIAAAPVRTEQICAAMSIPKKSQMPSGGWPTVVYAHGTGGSFRDFIQDPVAGVLARATPPMAVFGYDQVEHGTRRGTSTESPDTLFFNFANPDAARGNPMQAGADVVSIGRLMKTLSIPASVTGTTAMNVDTNALVFFGHSQGSMGGSLGLPFTNAFSAAVLSGNGAGLLHALLTKTSPQNIAAAVPFVLGADYDGQGKLFGGEYHPVLSIVQQWIDPGDPLNFGDAIGRSPESGILPKSIFQTYGIGDTYAPPVTLQAYAIAANLSLIVHDPSVTTPDAISNFVEQPAGLAGNFIEGGHTVTLGVREYQNSGGQDGHFVVFDVPSANADAVRFLSMAAAGSVPQIGN